MHSQVPFNSDLNILTTKLYENLRQPEALGEEFKYERFLQLVSLWNRESRLFHGLPHMLAMSELPPNDLPKTSQVYAMVGGFLHDIEYPSIGENVTSTTQRFIDTYVDRNNGNTLKPLAADDRAGHILYGIFGFKEGDTLSPFAGMNEFYSAVAAVGELKELGKDDKFIAGVTAVIEGTIPFKKPERMDELRARIEKTSQATNLGFTVNDIDELMIAATYTANKDVSGFLGGLDPLNDKTPTTQSVLNTIQGGDMLSPEEIPSMRAYGKPRNTPPGDYPSDDFLKARVKRAGLYQLVLTGTAESESIGNLFYETRLSGGNYYPPRPWAENAGKLAYANNQPVRIAEYSRLISQAVVNSIAKLAGSETDPNTTALGNLVAAIGDRLKTTLPENASEIRHMAFAAVNGRHQVNGGDTTRSALAELVLAKLDETQIDALGRTARKLVAPAPGEAPLDPADFLAEATKQLGTTVTNIRDEMAQTARQKGNQTAALAIKGVNVPMPNMTDL